MRGCLRPKIKYVCFHRLIFQASAVMGPTVKGLIYCRGQAEEKMCEKTVLLPRALRRNNFIPARTRCGPDFTSREV
jgi:hypothetical protein